MKFAATACYAALQAGFDQSVDSAFWNLVSYVIHKHEYTVIDIKSLCDDFESEFGFGIPYFPMKRILTLAAKQGFVKSNHTGYLPVLGKLGGAEFEQKYAEYETTYKRLIQLYLQYVQKEFGLSQEPSEAKEEIDRFIEGHGLTFFSIHEMSSNGEMGEVVKIGYFIRELQINYPELYKFLDALIVGRILKELIIHDEVEGTSVKVSAQVYIDTDFALRLLGIDTWERQEIYKSLVESMQAMGMTVKVFHHTHKEMDSIIAASMHWINNPNYDPILASDAATYFVRNHYTKNQVDELLNNLRKKLGRYDIEVEDMPPYPAKLPLGVLHEQDVFNLIVQEYERTNEKFDLEDMRYTIEQDARSLFFTQFNSRGMSYNRLTDMTHIFVTSNTALAWISGQMAKSSSTWTSDSLSFCVTDVSMGHLVWLNSPNAISVVAQKKLDLAILSAFVPSKEFLEKLSNSLKQLEERGEISSEEAYAFRANRLALQKTVRATMGNPKRFTDEIVRTVLLSYHEEGRREGIEEERTKANQIIGEKDQEIKNLQTEAQLTAELRATEKSLYDNRIRRDQLSALKTKANKTVSRKKTRMLLIYFAVLLLWGGLGVCLGFLPNAGFFNMYTIIDGVIAIIGSFLFFYWSGGKERNVLNWNKTFTAKHLPKALIDLGHNSEKDIEAEITELKNTILANEQRIKMLGGELP